MPIGGAERRNLRYAVLDRFTHLAGNSHSRIVVIPTASSTPYETGQQYIRIFTELGCSEVECLDVADREEADDPACTQKLDDATGIFLTGGDQLKLLSLIGGTRISATIEQRWMNGAIVAGTSAGASALSKHMIAFGQSGTVPARRLTHLAPGLGLAEELIIDQHFRQRQRIGRLMTAVAFNPSLLGVGLDENTALIIAPDGSCEIVGSGSVTVIDGSHLAETDIERVKGYTPAALLGIQVHILKAGYSYNLPTREAFSASRRPTPDAVSLPYVRTPVDVEM